MPAGARVHGDPNLYVLTAVSNPQRFASRHRLYRDFAERMAAAGAILYTVEVAYGRRAHEVTEGRPEHIQLRTSAELWHKENALNVGLRHLSRQVPGWEYVAFVDADFAFARADWAAETVQQLQHHACVQCFSEVAYLAADCRQSSVVPGFVAGRQRDGGLFYSPSRPADYPCAPDMTGTQAGAMGPPGGAWAFRRQALERVGGLLDCGILGSGDNYMALGIYGRAREALRPSFHANYKGLVLAWQERARRVIRQNVGIVPGMALHYWHGPMKFRQYGDRWQILVRHRFDPLRDLVTDTQGLWAWHDDGSDRHIRLRDDVCSYFRQRNEDA